MHLSAVVGNSLHHHHPGEELVVGEGGEGDGERGEERGEERREESCKGNNSMRYSPMLINIMIV